MDELIMDIDFFGHRKSKFHPNKKNCCPNSLNFDYKTNNNDYTGNIVNIAILYAKKGRTDNYPYFHAFKIKINSRTVY